MYYETSLQKCITQEQLQAHLQLDCTAQGNHWVNDRLMGGVCIDFEMAGGNAILGLLRQLNSRTLTLKYNGLPVDLFRKAEFDDWFEQSMTEAPQQLHQWKQQFDKWADKRIAQVLVQKDALAAQKAFDSFLIQLEDSDALVHLIKTSRASETAEAKANDVEAVMLASKKESESEGVTTSFVYGVGALVIVLISFVGIGLHYASSRSKRLFCKCMGSN